MNKISIFLCALALFSCSNKSEDKERTIPIHNYSEISDKSIKWESVFKQDKSNYYVYFYQEHCSHCHQIKDEVIDIALNKKNNIYFCSDSMTVVRDYDPSLTIGKRNINDIFIRGFPSLIYIDVGIVIKNVCGSSKAINELRE